MVLASSIHCLYGLTNNRARRRQAERTAFQRASWLIRWHLVPVVPRPESRLSSRHLGCKHRTEPGPGRLAGAQRPRLCSPPLAKPTTRLASSSKMSKPNLVVRWVEHIWTRMRRLDYWNDSIASHYPHKYYRAVSPGSQPPAEVPISEPENVYSIRCNPTTDEPSTLAAAASHRPPRSRALLFASAYVGRFPPGHPSQGRELLPGHAALPEPRAYEGEAAATERRSDAPAALVQRLREEGHRPRGNVEGGSGDHRVRRAPLRPPPSTPPHPPPPPPPPTHTHIRPFHSPLTRPLLPSFPPSPPPSISPPSSPPSHAHTYPCSKSLAGT